MSLDGPARRAAFLAGAAELPEPLREPLLLRTLEGLSFEEIGERHSQRPGAIRARVQRLMPQLLACMQRRMGGSV